MFDGYIYGRLEGNPHISNDDQGEIAEFTIGVMRYDGRSKKTFIDKICVVTSDSNQNAMEKIRTAMTEDYLFVTVDIQFIEGNISFYATDIKRLGEEGVNIHYIVGAVEDNELTYTSNGTEKCAMNVRVPVEKYTEKGEYFDNWLKVTTWKRQAENAHEYLKPEGGLSKWAIFRCETLLKSFENQEGEKIRFLQATARRTKFTQVKTESTNRGTYEEERKPKEGVSYGYNSKPLRPNRYPDEDIPF